MFDGRGCAKVVAAGRSSRNGHAGPAALRRSRQLMRLSLPAMPVGKLQWIHQGTAGRAPASRVPANARPACFEGFKKRWTPAWCIGNRPFALACLGCLRKHLVARIPRCARPSFASSAHANRHEHEKDAICAARAPGQGLAYKVRMDRAIWLAELAAGDIAQRSRRSSPKRIIPVCCDSSASAAGSTS